MEENHDKKRNRKKSSFIGLCVICLVIFSGCARLPDYALPRRGIRSNETLRFEEVITYRQLTRDDFKATELPPDRIMHKSNINAYTCARIRPTHDTKFTMNRVGINGAVTYFGSIQNIAFEAIMLPGCSWWNPTLQTKFQSYVLQHEQIHFAIAELTARRLTAAVREPAKTFIAIEQTAEAVKAKIAAKVNSWILSATDESLATHKAFDEDTSLFHSPKWQRFWQDKINRQLAEFEELPSATKTSGTDKENY